MKNFLNRPVTPWKILVLGLTIDLIGLWPKLGLPGGNVDVDHYLRDARNLLAFGTFGHPPSYGNMPGFPFILAVFLKVLPENYIILANLFLFAVSSVVLFKLLEEMNVRLRLWSAGLVLFLWFLNPFFAFLRSQLFSENAFIPSLMLATLCLVRYLRGQSVKNLYAAMVAFALAVYIRPVGFYLPLLCLFPVLFFRKSILHFVAALLLWGALLVPWGVRNYALFGDFALMTNQVAEGFWGGNNTFMLYERPDLKGNWIGLDQIQKMTQDSSLKEQIDVWMKMHLAHDYVNSENYAKERVLEFWRNHLWKMPGFALHKLKWFWHFSGRHPSHRSVFQDILGVIWYFAWLPLVFMFLLKEWKKPIAILFITYAIYFSAISVVTFGMVRFRMPVEFLLILFSIYSVPFVLKKAER